MFLEQESSGDNETKGKRGSVTEVASDEGFVRNIFHRATASGD